MERERIVARVAVFGLLSLVTACQFGANPPSPSDRGGADVAGLNQPNDEPELEKITVSELRAYCPRVILRQGTAIYTDFERGGEGDRSKIRFQTSISDVTRACKYSSEMLTMVVAAAGKVVPGPVASGDSVTVPLRVVAIRGSDVLYSQLHNYQIPIPAGSGATQFVFSDENVQIPVPTQTNYRIYIGFDKGEEDEG